jgi:hypothetical protein
MPTIIARIAPEWIRVAVARDTWELFEPESYRLEFTQSLLSEIPEYVAEVITEVDGKALDPGEVVIYPDPNHEWALNASDFLFDVQPGNGGLTDPAAQQERRAAIEDKLGAKIAGFISDYPWPDRPDEKVAPATFDIEARPISCSGHTYQVYREEGEDLVLDPHPVHSWGQPGE